MKITVDEFLLNDVERFILKEEFLQFMMNKNSDYRVSVFIIQTLMDKIKELRNIVGE